MPQIVIDKKKKTVTITLEYDESEPLDKHGRYRKITKPLFFKHFEQGNEAYVLSAWVGRQV